MNSNLPTVIVLLLLGVVLAGLDFNAGISAALIASGIVLILISVRKEKPEDERFRRLGNRSLAYSWVLTILLLSAIFALSKILELEYVVSSLIVSTLLFMLTSTGVFRSLLREKG